FLSTCYPLFRASKVIAQTCLACGPEPERVRSVFLDNREWIDDISFALTHLLSLFVDTIAHYPCIAPWHLARQLNAPEHCAMEPGAEDIFGLRHNGGWVSVIKQFRLPGICRHIKRADAGSHPGVKRALLTCKVSPAALFASVKRRLFLPWSVILASR